jgi:hypothetical protein
LLAHELTHTIQQGAAGEPSLSRSPAPEITPGAAGLVQRQSCEGKSYKNCYGKCTHPVSGKAGRCMWSGITYGCRCQENPTLEAAKQVLYELIIAALIAAGIILTAVIIAAIIACLSGPCEVAALIGAVGFAAAMIIIGIIKGSGAGGSSPAVTPGPTAAAGGGAASEGTPA